MQEFKKLTDGTTGASHFDRVLARVMVILSLYILPYVLTACVVIITLVNIVVWVLMGFVWVFWLAFLIYSILIFGSYGLGKLTSNPDYKIFEGREWLYRVVQILDLGMKWIRKFHNLLFIEAKKVGIFLIRQKAKLLVWSAQKFWALPRKYKVMITFAVALVVTLSVSTSLYISVKTVQTAVAKYEAYGKNRDQMSNDTMMARKENRINFSLWAVWGKPNAVKNAQAMENFKSLIYSEARKNGITPERLEAQLFVESASKTDPVNNISGAAGIAQIMLTVGCEEGLVMDKAFCSLVAKSAGTQNPIKFIPKDKKIEDRRLDPNYAIPTAARIIGKGAKYWGDENWAYVQYHMGIGNERKLAMYFLDETHPGWRSAYPANFDNKSDPNRSIPKALEQYNITYDDIFFRCSPNGTPKTYAHLYRMADSTATYVYTGLAALKGFDLMRNNPSAFQAMVAAQQDPDGGVSNRPMRAWYSDGAAKYNNLSDVANAVKTGELVPVPNNASNGFVLRTSGADRIGECDPGNEAKYYFTQKATLGMIYFIASKTQELGADPFEVTGLVRTNWMYDVKKCLPDTKPRTHIIASAFDIGFFIKGQPKSETTRQALIFVIRDLLADGLIDRIDEGKADHIVYNPEFQKFFEDIYNDKLSGSSPLIR